MKKLFTAIMFAASVLMAPAYAQETVNPEPSTLEEFRVLVYDVPQKDGSTERIFYYDGSIGATSSERLLKAIELYPDVKTIAFNSPGGLASEAHELGALYSNYGLNVWVPKGRLCLSACANAFLGGTNYEIDGVLGFHSAWLPNEYIATLSPSNLNQLFGHGQFSGAEDAYYYMINGFAVQLPMAIHAYTSPERFLVFTHEDELNKYYVRNDNESEVDGVIPYLTYDSTRPQNVWGGSEMQVELSKQWSELEQSTGPGATLVEVIFDGVTKDEAELN